MKIRLIAAGLIGCLLLLTQLVHGRTAAAAAEVKPHSYGISFTEGGSSLTGLTASRQEYFHIPDYWNVQALQVKLDYQVTPLVRNDRSSVTLALNGTPFHSFRPADNPAAKQQLSVSIPKELMTKGTNTLSIAGHIETTEVTQACLPDETHGNWLELYDSSRVDVQYTLVAMTNTISDFSLRFVDQADLSNGGNAIMVPEQSDQAELEAAVYALSGFAKSNRLKDKPIPLLTYSESNLKDKKAVIVVALFDRLPAELKNLVNPDKVNNHALLQLVQVNGRSVLVLTSKNSDLLVKAGRLAANQALLDQLQADRKELAAVSDVTTPAVNISRTVSLTEIGDELKGQSSEQTYFVQLPSNRSIAEASKISLDFRYSKNLDFDRSMVTILVNNTPIGSKKLSSELANGDSLSLAIPRNLNISGNFSVTAAFNLELMNTACVQEQDRMPWAFITKDSMLQLNTRDRTELLFNNYPYPLLRDGSFNQVGVVLPKVRDAYTYRTLANLFHLLGQYAEGNTGEVRFYDDSATAKQLKDRNLIVIGSYTSNKVIRDNNEKLYFQYDDTGSRILSNEKMSVDSEYGKRLGTLQLIDSPYGSGSGMLAVTGAASEFEYLASKLVASEGTMWRIYGDAAITDKDGHVQAFRFKKEADAEQPSAIADVLERSDVLAFMVTVLSILVLVFAALLLLVRKYRRRRREER